MDTAVRDKDQHIIISATNNAVKRIYAGVEGTCMLSITITFHLVKRMEKIYYSVPNSLYIYDYDIELIFNRKTLKLVKKTML